MLALPICAHCEGRCASAARQGIILLAALFFWVAFSSGSKAGTLQGTEITSLPYTVTIPGAYHLRHDLSGDPGSGAAITVNASEVTIDLNGYALRNSSTTPNGASRGISVLDRAHVTIRNGRIERFAAGVAILSSTPGSPSSYGHFVETIAVSGSAGTGIEVTGANSTVARCQVLQMGVAAGGGDVCAIRMSGFGVRALNNEVSGGGLPTGGGRIVGICIAGTGSNAFVVRNRVGDMNWGIWFKDGAQGLYRNNLVLGASYPFIGGTNAGGNVPAQTDETADSDGNGLADLWELRYFGALGQSSSGDPDGDGVGNLQEFQTGSSPLDFYNGQPPTLSLVSGSGQVGLPGATLPVPLTVRLANGSGQSLVNAPVTFSVVAGGGRLALVGEPPASGSASVGLRTDANGQAACRFQLPSGADADCVVAVSPAGLIGVARPPAVRFYVQARFQGGGGPAAPDSVTANAPSASKVRLAWTEHSTDETGFALERSVNGGATWAALATVGANTRTFTDHGAKTGVGHSYRVSAFNAIGRSPATLTAAPTTPALAAVAGKSAAFSPVGGAIGLQAPAADESSLSLPFAARPVAFGKVASVSASAVSIVAGSLTPGQFRYSAPGQRTTYYVQFASGALTGLACLITDNTADTLNLQTDGSDLGAHPLGGAAASGDLIKICPCRTVAEAFGSTETALSIEASPAPGDLRDHVLIPDYATTGIDKAPAVDLVYLSGAGWRRTSDLGGADCGDTALLPGRAFKVRRLGSSPAALIATGFIPTHRTVLRVPGGDGASGNETLLALAYPDPMSLDGMGLGLAADPASGVIAPSLGDPATSGDEARIHRSLSASTPGASGGVEDIYRATETGWLKLGAASETDAGEKTLLRPGGAILLRKTVASPARYWILPAVPAGN